MENRRIDWNLGCNSSPLRAGRGRKEWGLTEARVWFSDNLSPDENIQEIMDLLRDFHEVELEAVLIAVSKTFDVELTALM